MLTRTLLLLALAAALAAPVAAAVPQDLITHTTPLGKLAMGVASATGDISPDSSRLAFPAQAGPLSPADRQNIDPADLAAHLEPLRLILDGEPTLATARLTSATFSPDSHHVAYAMKVRDKWQVLLDGKPVVTDADNISSTPAAFSPDSLHFATVMQKDYRWQVTVDGTPWAPIATPEIGLASFSPDSKHFLLVARTKNSAIPYQDGQPLPPLSPNATPPKPLERFFPSYTWKPDSTGIGFYGAYPGQHWQVFTTGPAPFASPPFDAILRNTPVFSPDSTSLAFAAQSRGKWTVYTSADQSPAPPFEELLPNTLRYLAPENDGPPRLFYIAKRAGHWQLYINHAPVGQPFDALVDDRLAISPDKKHFAYFVPAPAGVTLIRDGRPVATYDAALPLTLAFSPDSSRLAYAARFRNRWHVCIDAKPGAADFHSINPVPISFSPYGETVAFGAQLNPGISRLYVGINADYQSPFFDNFLPGCNITWRNPHALVTLTTTKMIATRLEATLPNTPTP